MPDKVSIIIPALNELFLQKTIDNIFENASGEIEVIVMLDNWWPKPMISDRQGMTIVHTNERLGVKKNTNSAARIATGKYLMKCDAHCAFSKGFDKALKKSCKENWVCIPSRYSLDPDKWERTRGPFEYLMLTYPFIKDDVYGYGFHGKKWRGEDGLNGGFWHLEEKRKKYRIDDIIIFQGSCWFMTRDHFFNIGGLEIDYYMFQEAPEISFKTWLSGGRVVRNKRAWYAHLHKGKEHSGNYALSKSKKYEIENFMVDYWMGNKWPKQTRDFKWLIDYFFKKFSPMGGWPEDWWDEKYREAYKKEVSRS